MPEGKGGRKGRRNQASGKGQQTNAAGPASDAAEGQRLRKEQQQVLEELAQTEKEEGFESAAALLERRAANLAPGPLARAHLELAERAKRVSSLQQPGHSRKAKGVDGSEEDSDLKNLRRYLQEAFESRTAAMQRDSEPTEKICQELNNLSAAVRQLKEAELNRGKFLRSLRSELESLAADLRVRAGSTATKTKTATKDASLTSVGRKRGRTLRE
ncbi:unnamed protein product [Effrenium voratum]|nr:unnamed protein product [Effrenium voratum]